MVFLFRLFVGVLFCLTPVTAVIAVGWTARAMRRSSLKRLYRSTGGKDFATFAAARPDTAGVARWPNWVLGVKGRDTGIARALGGLWANIKTGVLILTNVWILTLPAGLIWLGAWWAGWNNSFTKGYEQALVAPLASVAAVGLFALVMTYLPMAQARQAMAGRWRAFWSVRTVRHLARRTRVRLLILALATLALALPVTGIRVFPMAAQNIVPGFAGMSDDELRGILNLFFVAATFFVFPAYVFVHLWSARLYAIGVARAAKAGTLPSVALGRAEWDVLERLGIGHAPAESATPAILAAAGTAGRGAVRIASIIAEFAAWAALAGLVYVQQFLIYLWFAWLTHPLIHLPWVRHIPL